MMVGRGEGQPAAGGPAHHIPVLLDEVVSALCVKEGGVYLDGTFGAGGYSRALLARGARVPLCGAISQYNIKGAEGPKNYLSLLINRARMEGFIVFDFASRYQEAAVQMAGWLMAGKLKSREDIVPGLETFPDTLLKLFSGENKGKLVLKVADE